MTAAHSVHVPNTELSCIALLCWVTRKVLQLLLSCLNAQNTGNHAVWWLMQIKDLGVKAGVVLNPATPIEAIQHVITQVDLILLMSGKLCGHKYIAPCL